MGTLFRIVFGIFGGSEEAGGGPSGDGLLLEIGDFVLLENGDFFLLE